MRTPKIQSRYLSTENHCDPEKSMFWIDTVYAKLLEKISIPPQPDHI